MAEENNQENEKKSPLKLILMIVGGIVLLGTGIGVGIFMGGGGDTDPSAEISQIIEKKKILNHQKMKTKKILMRLLLNVRKKKRTKKVIVLQVQRRFQKSHLKKKSLQQRIMSFLAISQQI